MLVITPLREGQIVDYIYAVASRHICVEMSTRGALLITLSPGHTAFYAYDTRLYKVVCEYAPHERAIYAVYRLGGAPAVVHFLKTL